MTGRVYWEKKKKVVVQPINKLKQQLWNPRKHTHTHTTKELRSKVLSK